MDSTQPASHTLDPPPAQQKEDDWNSDPDSDDSDDDEDNDSDIDAEAEEIARRLGEQLWALNNPAGAASNDVPVQPAPEEHFELPEHPPQEQPDLADQGHPSTKEEEAALATIRTILAILENDPPAKELLSSTALPGLAHNVLDILQQSSTSKSVAKPIRMPLSQVLVELARCEQLFGDLRLSNAPAIQLDRGKRKRDELEDHHDPNTRLTKRPYVPEEDLQPQVMEAVRIISQALSSAPTNALDPSLISSIQVPLHQVFLFAVTSSARIGPAMHALQEISGLIQVIGVVSGIQIGQHPHQNPHPFGPVPGHPWAPGHAPHVATDIGTAVYPCLISGCCKTFSRLYSLRAHQRNHAVHRPFRCTICPASFARNHDLKRHIRLHDRKAWKCGACQKIFSRRDAFKRHKDGSRARGLRSEDCATADVIEVELDEEDGNDVLREERRAKLWTGLANSHAAGVSHPHRDSLVMEEGEVPENIIQMIQGSVLSLHGLLQAHVGNALGVPASHGGHPAPPMVDAAGSQATLASVIARAQSQALPAATPPDHMEGVDQTDSMDFPSHPEADSSQSRTPPTISEGNQPDASSNGTSLTPLSMYGLSDEQTKLLELAIANAASLAQAQAEAEAALEEEDEDDSDRDDDDDEDGEGEDQPTGVQDPVAV
ncbi:hypothetical protein DFP72DRAFT_524915 [Ephemerocybe angulata]|uniref:C2H2-type domain-containing protein n=1 Tax=Ephemerocybe angulata TaxID=980116 RepID=A0A8H6MG45_9AGAR|nr:hypothetical protein DFP72DRAFT_524915 [Tulosesus angulatus]